MSACAGELDTTARSSGNRLIVDDKDCSLTIARRGTTGIRIDERQCITWYGAACEFTSDLARR